MKELFMELINEMVKLSIPELEEVKKEWLESLEGQEVSERVVAFCMAATDLVIAKKREKEGAVL